MRVAVWHNLPSGGGLRALGDQIAGLKADGHEVGVFAPPTAERVEGVPVTVVGGVLPEAPHAAFRNTGAIVSFQRRRRVAALEQALAAAVAIDAGGWDVVLAHPCRSLRITPLARHLNTRAVLYLQEPNRALYEARPALPWALPDLGGLAVHVKVRRRVFDAVTVHGLRSQVADEAADLRHYGTVLVNSAFSRESVLRAYGVDADVCELGVDTDRFTVGSPVERRLPFVMSVGALVADKDPLAVIAAVAGLGAPRPNLVWVANHIDADTHETAVRSARETGVSFVVRTAIADSDLLTLYRTTTAFIYAPRLEPFGYAPLEAGACGAPVVARSEGGLRETIVHGVNGLLANDVHGLTALLAKVLDDQGLASDLGRSAAEHVAERWSPAAARARLNQALSAAIRPTLVR